MGDFKKKRILLDEIKGLEEIVHENDEIKNELEKRLRQIEEKRAQELGLNNRSISPIIINRAMKKELSTSQIHAKPNLYTSSPKSKEHQSRNE